MKNIKVKEEERIERLEAEIKDSAKKINELEIIKMGNTKQKIFHTPDIQKINGNELSFFLHAIEDGQEFLIENIEDIISRNPHNRARILYEIAEVFRREIVEDEKRNIDVFDYEPYREILYDAIERVDNFKIAEELLEQYERYEEFSKSEHV